MDDYPMYWDWDRLSDEEQERAKSQQSALLEYAEQKGLRDPEIKALHVMVVDPIGAALNWRLGKAVHETGLPEEEIKRLFLTYGEDKRQSLPKI